MPGPDSWTDDDAAKAQSILDSGKGTPEQLQRLRSAIGQFQARNSDSGIPPGETKPPIELPEENITGQDPLAASRAALQQVRTGGQSRELLQPREQRGVGETAALNAFQGMTFDYGDELAAKTAATIGLLRPGSSYGEGEFLGDLRQQIRETQEDHPVVAGLSRVGGASLPAALVGASLPRAATLGGAAAQGAGIGLAEGAVSGSGAADDGDRVAGAVSGSLPGAIGGAAGGAIGKVVGDAMPGAIEGVRNFARRKRAASTGMTPSDAKNMVRQQGRGSIEEFGQEIEDQGLHRSGLPTPTGLGTYAENSGKATAEAGPEIGAFSQEMLDKGVRVDTGAVAQEMADDAGKLERLLSGASDAAGDANELRQRALALAHEGRPTYDRVFETRRWLDEQAYHFERAENTKAADLYRSISAKLRAALFDSVDDPNDLARLQQLNKKFEVGARTKNYSEAAEATENASGTPLGTYALRIGSAGLASPRGKALQSATARRFADMSEVTLDNTIGGNGTMPAIGSALSRKIAELRQEQELERVRQQLPQ